MLKQKPIAHLVDDVFRVRFLAKVQRGDTEACWPWNGARRDTGYGVMKRNGVTVMAHRIAVVVHTGRDIPEGFVVDHTCFNKACCNPAHLQVITQSENISRYYSTVNPSSTCKRGHVHERGKDCRECSRVRQAEWIARNPDGRLHQSRVYEAKRAKRRRKLT
jgi:hypothetical protein